MNENYHCIEMHNTTWCMPSRYRDIKRLLGAGAYGQVVDALDKDLNQRVAIKKMSKPFVSAHVAKLIAREILILKHLKHENIIRLLDVFTSESTLTELKNIYVVTELMEGDLRQTLKSNQITNDQAQIFVYQLLRGLKYIHSAGIIHRDLKPENIAVTSNLELKILDFGLARPQSQEMTGYVVTRWYRAPEIILNWMHYGKEVDVWSVGCIMAEMLSGKPLFPAINEFDHLNKIMRLVGNPSADYLPKIRNQDARDYVKNMTRFQPKNFKDIFYSASSANPLPSTIPDSEDAVKLSEEEEEAKSAALDLLKQMLVFDPDNRITAQSALAHSYLSKYADITDEPEADAFDDSLVKEEISLNEWKSVIFQTIKTFENQ